jgi:hypothetical protein
MKPLLEAECRGDLSPAPQGQRAAALSKNRFISAKLSDKNIFLSKNPICVKQFFQILTQHRPIEIFFIIFIGRLRRAGGSFLSKFSSFGDSR